MGRWYSGLVLCSKFNRKNKVDPKNKCTLMNKNKYNPNFFIFGSQVIASFMLLLLLLLHHRHHSGGILQESSRGSFLLRRLR